jgi:hypothetical protein
MGEQGHALCVWVIQVSRKFRRSREGSSASRPIAQVVRAYA